MAFSEQNPLDYRSGGDRVKTWGAKYKQEISHIYNILNYLLTHQAYGDVAIQDEDGAMKIFTVQIDNGDGTTTTERHLGIGIKTGDNFEWVDIGQVKARFGASLTKDTLTSNDVATQEYEAYKLIKTNANGILPTDITGSAAKMVGKVIQVNNLSDGQVMVWRAYDGCWHNENKAAVGEGKALEIRNGNTTLVVFSGESDQLVDVGKWNDVTLAKTIDNAVDIRYLPTLEGTASETSKLQKATPEAEGKTIAIRDTDGNVLTATADVNDETHKAASTANVAAKISAHNNDSSAHVAAFARKLADFGKSTMRTLGYRQPNTAYTVGQIAYHASLPTGYYLECTTAGTTSAGDITPSSTIGDTVSDGEVVWTVSQSLSVLGGTIFNRIMAKRDVTNSGLTLIGADDYVNGAYINLYGKDSSTPSNFQITARNGSTQTDMIGKPTGQLTWGANDLAGSAIVAKSLGTNGYIKYASGLIVQWGVDAVSNLTKTIVGGWTRYKKSFPLTMSKCVFANAVPSTLSGASENISGFYGFAMEDSTTNWTMTFSSGNSQLPSMESHTSYIRFIAIGY